MAPQARLFNVGKRAGKPSVDQRFISRLLVRLAQRHRVVVRLKGGDPHLFGRASEELNACRAAGVAVATVPGVSAAFAAASALEMSLTRRGESRSVAFVTPSVGRGESDDLHWPSAAAAADTAVLYMGAMRAPDVKAALLAAGLSPNLPAAFVENASLPSERVWRGTLGDLEERAKTAGEGPVTIVLGAGAAATEIASPLRVAAVA